MLPIVRCFLVLFLVSTRLTVIRLIQHTAIILSTHVSVHYGTHMNTHCRYPRVILLAYLSNSKSDFSPYLVCDTYLALLQKRGIKPPSLGP